MARDPRAFLWDAREAALSIQRFVVGMNAASFAADELVRAAVERKFEVIGESLNQLAKVDTALAARVPDLAQIVAFRNQLIHGYATINAATVFNIARNALPGFVEVIQSLMDELG